MIDVAAFSPKAASTVSLAATATTSSVAVNTGETAKSKKWRIFNAGPNTVRVEFGPSAVTAVLGTAMPIPSGGVEVFSPGGATHLAGICAASETATVFITPGEGI